MLIRISGIVNPNVPDHLLAAERGLRKEWAERAGLGFEIPAKILVIGRNGRKPENAPLEAVAVSA
jgi:hypothetical protein